MNFHPVPSLSGSVDLLLINSDFSKNELGVTSLPENHLGLNRLAGYLDDKGWACAVLDTTGRPHSERGPEELGEWLKAKADQCRMIGFHLNSWNVNHVLRTIKIAIDELKDKPILFGGALANSEPKRTLDLFKTSGLQCIGVVQGLGEKICDTILQSKSLLGVEGLWAFENGESQPGAKVGLTQEEFEQTPFLSLRHNPFYQQYYRPMLETQSLGNYSMEVVFGSQGFDVNRGCPFSCTYCSVPQYERKLITYSPQRVADELEYLAREAGFFMFTFTYSNIMFYTPEWIREFCQELIDRKMNEYLNWNAYHHPSIIAQLPVSDYQLMKEAGSDTIVFGVQSFEDEVLKVFLRPRNTPELTKIIREKSREAGQEMSVDYITGVPGESLDIIQEAFEYFAKNDIECRNYQLKFYPNTRLPMMKLDLSHHDLVPITGELAPELSAYAVVPKTPNPRAAQLDGFIRKANGALLKKRPTRLGKYIIDTPEKAQQLYREEIPNNPFIPEKVKIAMRVALKAMMEGQHGQRYDEQFDPAQMMKRLVMAGADAPPMVKAMQEKLRNELGEEKFQELREKYGGTS